MAFGGPRSSCVHPGAHSARRLRSLAFLCSSAASGQPDWRGCAAGLLRPAKMGQEYRGHHTI